MFALKDKLEKVLSNIWLLDAISRGLFPVVYVISLIASLQHIKQIEV